MYRIILMFLFITILVGQTKKKQKRNPSENQFKQNGLVMISHPKAKTYEDAWSDKREVTIFDLENSKEIMITDDLYSDDNPSFHPNGKEIYFDSKRPNKGMFASNGESHIYKYDIKRKQINRFDDNLKEMFPGKIGGMCENPNWNKDSKLAFITSKKKGYFFKHYLCVYDEELKRLAVVDSTNDFFYNISWSEKNNKLYYERKYNVGNNEGIILNADSNKKEKIDIEDVYLFQSWHPSCESIIYKNTSKTIGLQLFKYEIKSRSIIHLYENRKIVGELLSFGKSSDIIFVGESDEKNNKFNLLQINLTNNTIMKLNENPIYFGSAKFIQ